MTTSVTRKSTKLNSPPPLSFLELLSLRVQRCLLYFDCSPRAIPKSCTYSIAVANLHLAARSHLLEIPVGDTSNGL
ncbi:hypothetical protein M011DRAFT_472857, partial [Sporormia fimetaria CBS 119925]